MSPCASSGEAQHRAGSPARAALTAARRLPVAAWGAAAWLAVAAPAAAAAPDRPPGLAGRILAAAEQMDRAAGAPERSILRNRPYRVCLLDLLLSSDLPNARLERLAHETEAGREDPLMEERPDLFAAATARCPQGGLPR